MLWGMVCKKFRLRTFMIPQDYLTQHSPILRFVADKSTVHLSVDCELYITIIQI